LQSFFISSDSDTTIQTLHGSVIRISAASFNVTGEISLVIREAFTAAEILAAGMITESNGKPLRSGGMIYLNAMAKGQPVELLKPIKVSIANQYFDSSMQVFKGDETDSSGINWVEPSPVDTTPQSTQWERGKMLFGMCRSCHYITKYGTGPALKDVEYRAPWINNRKKLYRYIRNWNEIAREDPAIQRVLNYTPAVMQLFPNLSDVDIDAILDYLCSVANRHRIQFLWRPFLKDSEDDMILELAVEGRCDCIITFNQRHCAGVEKQFGIRVLGPKEFLKEIGHLS